ncbi:GNAT family N-acetyltransferase [Anaerobacillus alkaliphilus]|uniref:GNAT family N-acetyltransferase n=1 Tax=Anaerobacillus alkaliphilus TaxID=1548597 RepID=A0A4Q0VYL5_9BACI|nr:GNAT family N-acetyltransferase [Anaerobacillus alkaliphilus]RXJ04550.1 GNAT family N-acetyltransferase [Anaerobacillus alkaliphilus]
MNKQFTIRPATMDDDQVVTNLITAVDIAEYGVPDITIEDVLEIWSEIPLKKNTWIIEKADQIVGYGYLEEISKGRLDCYGYVHPTWQKQGIGSHLIQQMEIRAEDYLTEYDKEDVPYEFNHVIPANNPSAVTLVENKGYKFARVFSRMKIELETEPEVPTISDNVIIIPFELERDAELLYEAYNESFKDTRGYYEEPIEKWLHKVTSEPFDQSLSYVAYLDQTLTGFIICKNYPEGTFIEFLGVRSLYRKKGIGAALLKMVFKESYRRNIQTVLLNVDSNSKSGANKLYESVGMKSTFQIAVYQRTN